MNEVLSCLMATPAGGFTETNDFKLDERDKEIKNIIVSFDGVVYLDDVVVFSSVMG